MWQEKHEPKNWPVAWISGQRQRPLWGSQTCWRLTRSLPSHSCGNQLSSSIEVGAQLEIPTQQVRWRETRKGKKLNVMRDSLRCVSNILKLKKNVAHQIPTISYLQQAPWLFDTTIRQAAPKSQWASFDHRKRCSYGFPVELRLESIVSTSGRQPPS